LNKEKPLYDESKWFRKWEQQRIYKMREQAIKFELENLIGTGSTSWMILFILPVIPPALR
jgi:DNA-directed RNA polymerase beta' subunit